MKSLGWIIASANQISYYSCVFCILSPEDLFCVGGRGNNIAIPSFSSLFMSLIYHNLSPSSRSPSSLLAFFFSLHPLQALTWLVFTCLPSVRGSCTLMNSAVPECLFSHSVLSSHHTPQYFYFSAWWHWWQPHKTLHVRAVTISVDQHIIGLFLFSKEWAITV